MAVNGFELGEKEIERKKLEPKVCRVIDVSLMEQTLKDRTTKNIVVLTLKHPDKAENIEVRKVKVEDNGKLAVKGLWVTLDDEKKILKNSALGQLMNHYKVQSLNGFIGLEVATAHNEEGYLVVKGY